MVHYLDLIPGKRYKLGDMNVGKFIRKTDDTLVFIGSQYGEDDENEIDADDEDNYKEIKPKSKAKSVKKTKSKGGTRRRRRYTYSKN